MVADPVFLVGKTFLYFTLLSASIFSLEDELWLLVVLTETIWVSNRIWLRA